MLDSLILNDFKSFEGRNVIPIHSITTLIGLNSSGKTNVLEGLSILSQVVSGVDITAYFNNYTNVYNNHQNIRGGAQGCCRNKKKTFTLGCITKGKNNVNLEYLITIIVSKTERIVVDSESLVVLEDNNSEHVLFKTIRGKQSSGDIKVEYNNNKPGPNPRLTINKNSSVISQIKNAYSNNISERNNATVSHILESSTKEYFDKSEITELFTANSEQPDMISQADVIIESLAKINNINPVPEKMRNYVPRFSGSLQSDGSNLSAVLYKLCKYHEQYSKYKNTQSPDNMPTIKKDDTLNKRLMSHEKMYQSVLRIINLLPEYTISELKILTTPAPLYDVMFSCVEKKANGDTIVIPASQLSNGLLRITALAVAVITLDKNSILLLDEFDSAINESKTLPLLEKIQQNIKKSKSIAILSTHDIPLMNAYTPELLNGTIIIFRNKENNTSECTSFYSLPNIESLVTQGGLGDAVLKDGLKPYIRPDSNSSNVSNIPEWLKGGND